MCLLEYARVCSCVRADVCVCVYARVISIIYAHFKSIKKKERRNSGMNARTWYSFFIKFMNVPSVICIRCLTTMSIDGFDMHTHENFHPNAVPHYRRAHNTKSKIRVTADEYTFVLSSTLRFSAISKNWLLPLANDQLFLLQPDFNEYCMQHEMHWISQS